MPGQIIVCRSIAIGWRTGDEKRHLSSLRAAFTSATQVIQRRTTSVAHTRGAGAHPDFTEPAGSVLQAGFGLTTPEERVQRIVKLLRTLTVIDLQQPVETQILTRYHQQAVVFSVNKKPSMVLVQADLDEGVDLTLPQAAEVVRQRLETLRLSLKEQYSPRYILASVAKSLVGAAALIMVNRRWCDNWR